MSKVFYCLGLMSGTSMDGIDGSIIYSNGIDNFEVIENFYCKYDNIFNNKLSDIRNKIVNLKDLKYHENELNKLEREITILHAEFANKILKNSNNEIDLIGFHGHTIYHNPEEKISKQLGDGRLLSQLLKKKIAYNFRENDINNNGNGAPLAPIYHSAIAKKIKKNNVVFLNIGGITNETFIDEKYKFSAKDLGPGNCLLDSWIRQKTKNKYDKDGLVARSGKVNKILLDQSLDVEEGAATIIEYTIEIIANKISTKNIIACGGGRKNKYLVERLENKIKKKIVNIDDFKIDGDFVESQAFAYLAIRSLLNLDISFPSTTGCNNDTTGGTII